MHEKGKGYGVYREGNIKTDVTNTTQGVNKHLINMVVNETLLKAKTIRHFNKTFIKIHSDVQITNKYNFVFV